MFRKLHAAFEQFKSSGVKISSRLLIELVISILLDPIFPHTVQSHDCKDNSLLTSKLIPSWVQQFMHIHKYCLAVTARTIDV